MPKTRTVQLWHAAAAGNVPAGLAEGEVALDALSDPPRLWTGVPTARDPSGRINMFAALESRVAALEAEVTRMRVRSWRPAELDAPVGLSGGNGNGNGNGKSRKPKGGR